jgi:hypothetical protein
MLELPLSSPDSITVTTEFGVLQETGNLTVITSGGAYLQNYGGADDDGVEMTENLHEEQHHASMIPQPLNTQMTLPIHIAPSGVGGAESSNDTGEEADVDTDDADAAAPLADDADDGVVTPTTAPAATGA